MAFPALNFLLSFKVALISTGVLSMAVILKLSVPVVTEFAVSDLPLIYTFILSWLQPPYLYLVINCIIITIVASSKLQLQKADDQDQQQLSAQPELVVPQPPAVLLEVAEKISTDIQNSEYISSAASGYSYQELTPAVKVVEDHAVPLETDTQVPKRSDSLELLIEKFEEKVKHREREKPSVSARFGHRKSLKASAEGAKAGALGVSRPKRHDTLECTWKTITDGRPIPLARHLKKSDTWDSQVRRPDPAPPPPPTSRMKKSETFHETNSPKLLTPQGSGKLRREPSLGHEELNRRVEAFINKFNEEMRLQRQESLNQYQEMISRGAY